MLEQLTALSPADAWQTVPPERWDEAAARHLLRRVGFGATPNETARAVRDGPEATVRRFLAAMPAFPKPAPVERVEEDAPEMAPKTAQGDPEARRAAAQAARERSREALLDMILRWLQLASAPANAPAEKWLLFLSDVWVVSLEKVQNAALIFGHQDLLRTHALGSAISLAKAMSRSPAMIVYLDLQQSRREAPNENFARELLELFTLGEGHYTETDIKEAARAFTGYRQKQGEFVFAARQHDDGAKTIFGASGEFDGDEVINLIFRQPAAATFLPREMVRFYLSETPLPEPYTDALGGIWREHGFDLRELAVRFFSGRAFYAAEYRSNFIKSPVQFYLGLLQDLELDVEPVPRRVVNPLRQMGQLPFDPPNVRGWVGGRAWINSATLAARRQLIDGLLHPVNEATSNADERAARARARAAGARDFALDDRLVAAWGKLPPDAAAEVLLSRTVPGEASADTRTVLESFLQASIARPEAAVRMALGTLLESPDYQLC